MSHTKEPWAAFSDGKREMNNVTHFIRSEAGDLVAYGHLSEDDAKRIVACVNACKRISTDILEGVAACGGISHEPIETIRDLQEQVECSTITRDNMEGRLNILIVKLAAMKEDRDTWQKRAEFSYQERQKLENQVEGLINQLSAHQRQAAIGKAIERACGELPEGFDLHIECEKDAATVRLYHPDGEEESEDLYCDSGLAGEIDNAINVAIAKGGAA